jgi:hypothetical protein
MRTFEMGITHRNKPRSMRGRITREDQERRTRWYMIYVIQDEAWMTHEWYMTRFPCRIHFWVGVRDGEWSILLLFYIFCRSKYNTVWDLIEVVSLLRALVLLEGYFDFVLYAIYAGQTTWYAVCVCTVLSTVWRVKRSHALTIPWKELREIIRKQYARVLLIIAWLLWILRMIINCFFIY